MKILFCGDVVGRSGRDAVLAHVPKLKKDRGIDFIIVNGDNAAGGFGIQPAIARDFFAAGIDVITGGDHIWDQKEIIPYLAQEKRLLRPQNFPDSVPGRGHNIYAAASGARVLVLHLLGQVFHKEQADCPFATADRVLAQVKLGAGVQAVFVDFHAEATSEKMAMGKYLDGRVSAVAGSHTHVPTADWRILPGGTAYQTDTGMCGDYDSIIGFAADAPLQRFLTKMPKIRLEAATGKASLSALLVETNDATGLAKAVEYIRIE